ncbi:MAG: hypothetical protein ACT6Q7_02660 [Blastomonas fulva]|uniref:hypothetical protein n=1 Tax=Blastomonas fulva TaxID=1550728 RepID=UPI004034EA04
MADDWQPGDLAMCIKTSHPAFEFPSTTLTLGKIYTVNRIGRPVDWLGGERALGLVEHAPRRADHGWPESLFCKIRSHTPDAEDAEIIRLLTGAPMEVPAHA